MSISSLIRNWSLVTQIRNTIPHSWVNFFWHFPIAFSAAIFYGFPSKKLKVIGVTGSKGKTTVVYGIYHLLKTAGKKVAMISTVKAIIGQQKIDTGFHVTSPQPWQLQKLIKQITDQGYHYLVLEATSHGLAQHRLFGVKFDLGVLTNIQPEHLDYHRTMKAYIKAKSKLFKSVNTAILNRDDQSYHPISLSIKTQNLPARIISYGISKQANIAAKKIILKELTSEFVCHSHQVRDSEPDSRLHGNDQNKSLSFKIKLNLPGKYNVYNSLAIIASAFSLGIKVKTIQKALTSFPQIPGRMQFITHKNRKIVIDFAHTPDSLQKALTHLKSILPKRKRLIAVFGCAGLRDTQKRPFMGKISAKLAQITILTAEDPRTEDINHIIDQIAQGCIKAEAKEIKAKDLGPPSLSKRGTGRVNYSITQLPNFHSFIRIPDRQQAINTAIKIAKPGDIVAILGKGHEKSMCFGSAEMPWSDQKAVQKSIKLLN